MTGDTAFMVILNILVFAVVNSLVLDYKTAEQWIDSAIGWCVGVLLVYFFYRWRDNRVR